jgi:hypothetical protein
MKRKPEKFPTPKEAKRLFREMAGELEVPTGEIGFATLAAIMVVILLFAAPLIF